MLTSGEPGLFCDDGRLLRTFVAMPLLERTHVDAIALQRGNAFSSGRGSHGGDGRNAVGDSGATITFVEPGFSAVRRVDTS
jgi:hypothetical protein